MVAFDDDEWLEITVWDEALPRAPVSTDRTGAGFVDGIAGPRTDLRPGHRSRFDRDQVNALFTRKDTPNDTGL